MRLSGARAVALVVVVSMAGVGCGVVRSDGEDAAGAWRTLPEAPLSPRDQAVVVEVGGQVLVVGGWEFLCPPMADCALPEAPLLDDGAVYDPAADAWRTITPPPFGVRGTAYGTAAVGDTAYLLTGCAAGPDCRGPLRLLSYDLTEDRWDDLGRVPGRQTYRHLTAVGPDLVVSSDSDEHGEVADLLYDVRRSSWSELPDDPLPRTYDRFVVPVGDQLVLAGSPVAAVESGRRVRQAGGAVRPRPEDLDQAPGRAGAGLPAAAQRRRPAAQRALRRLRRMGPRPRHVDVGRAARRGRRPRQLERRARPRPGDVRHREQRRRRSPRTSCTSTTRPRTHSSRSGHRPAARTCPTTPAPRSAATSSCSAARCGRATLPATASSSPTRDCGPPRTDAPMGAVWSPTAIQVRAASVSASRCSISAMSMSWSSWPPISLRRPASSRILAPETP